MIIKKKIVNKDGHAMMVGIDTKLSGLSFMPLFGVEFVLFFFFIFFFVFIKKMHLVCPFSLSVNTAWLITSPPFRLSYCIFVSYNLDWQ